jgi:diguanylate cyclase (GGDEF)-like protein
MIPQTTSPTPILIADDDPVARTMLQTLLIKWKYQVVVAEDGLGAIQILESADAPQMAILDWMMPGVEGPEICLRVRALSERPYVYILLVTGRGQRGDLLRGLEAGADDYLTKPFDSEELRARLLVGRRILDLQNKLIDAREKLRFKATHDALTGIPNRATALEAVNRERSRQVRDTNSFGIILIDIDHFKYVNDSYGHLVGDAVLQAVAQQIVGSVRPYDTVGRYGGEEFLVVVPLSDSADTMAIAERVRKRIEARPVSTDSGPVHVTISCGVAICSSAAPIEVHTLLYLADEALYRAKGGGRNRCELASVDPVLPQPLRSGLHFL